MVLLASRLGPYFACYFCGGRVVDLGYDIRCESEGVTWDKKETTLVVRVEGALLRGSTRLKVPEPGGVRK